MKTIYLTAGTEYVQFDELADRIASALHPLDDSATDGEMMAYGGARINLEAELLQAAKSGALPVKDPLTFGPHSFPVGNALKTALVSVNDLRIFLAGRPIAIESAPAQSTELPAPEFARDLPDTVEHSQVKRRTWRDVAWPYVVETFKASQYSTAKDFYRALENKAGASDSPFDKGTGVNLHSLYVREMSETVVLKTIQNAWAEIKASR